jgi:hypothetical protein
MIEILNITTLMGYLREAIDKIEDPRKPSPNKQYSLFDAALSAFGVFFSNAAHFWNTKNN